MKATRTIALLLAALAFAPTVFAQGGTAPCAQNDEPVSSPLQGTVGYTNTGTPIPDMTIEVFANRDEAPIAASQTDAAGRFSFPNIYSGNFFLKGFKKLSDGWGITAEGFVTVSRDARGIACLIAEAEESPSVSPQSSQRDSPDGRAVLVELARPELLPLVRMANLEGEVIVTVTVAPDGTTEASVVSGHPMLSPSALDSAIRSRFECRNCTAPVLYSLVYKFKRTSEGDCCTGMAGPVNVVTEEQTFDDTGRPRTRINITAERICLCDPAPTITWKARSAKCLYLWKCALRSH